jgi:probable selenate reductase FAD-binding subunit
MAKINEYYRPETVEEVLELMAREGVTTRVLAGGTQLNARLQPGDAPVAVVDLQNVGMDEVTHSPQQMACGAMVRIQTIVEDEEAPSLLREMGRREGPNTFRNAGTIGGAIVDGDPESEFVAALLAYDAVVTVQDANGAHSMPLEDLLADAVARLRGGLLTGVTLATDGATAHARVARTPQDKPIVAAIARRAAEDETRIALCGVAATPVLLEERDLASLQPPPDFRGSSEYRKEMAKVLVERVLREVGY